MRTVFFSALLLLGHLAPAQAPRNATVRAYLESPAPGAALLDAFTARVVVRHSGGSDTLTQACAGTCRFEQLPLGSTLVFSAFKDDFPRDSVGTYDLVQISKHTKGEEHLRTPYQYIAADADCNGLVNNKDIVILRALILRMDTSTCVPWKLIDARALLPENPLLAPLPYTITVRDYDGSALDFSFLAVKTGNVSGYTNYHPLPPPPGTFVAAPLPNPTSGSAVFSVQLPEPMNLDLEIFDAAGRRVYTRRLPGQAGAQQVELPADALPAAGTYFWRMLAGDRKAEGKLVRM